VISKDPRPSALWGVDASSSKTLGHSRACRTGLLRLLLQPLFTAVTQHLFYVGVPCLTLQLAL